MKRGERKCIICGSTYKYCSGCPDHDPKETWRNLYCSEGCREVFNIVSKYKNGGLTVGEAKMKLKSPAIDLSKKDQFEAEYKDTLDEILGSQDKSAEKKSEEKKPEEKRSKKEKIVNLD